MSLVDHCGFSLKTYHRSESRDDQDPDEDDDEEDSRFTVGNDMRANDRTPLKMKWAQFVWLALALGISAYDPDWQSAYPCTLRSSKSGILIHLLHDEDRLFANVVLRGKLSYSLRRAFAWYNVGLNGDRLLPLGHGKIPQVCLSSVTMSPELSTCRLGMNLASKGCDNIICGREPKDCTNALAAACCWMLYWRRQCVVDEPLPVSQHLLEFRQRVLCHLKLLDDQKQLATRVQSLVLAKTVEDNATQQSPDLAAVLSTTQEPEDATPPHPAPPLRSTADTGATENEQSTGPVPLNTQEQPLVQGILQQLRASFASSEYAQRYVKFCDLTISLETEMQNALFPILMSRSRTTFAEKILERCQMVLSTLEAPLCPPEHWQTGQDVSKKDVYDIIPKDLRAELEQAAQAWESNPEGDDVSRWKEGVDGIGLLACIALALADWDHYRHETWRLCED
jgi:hypothetical protein